MVQEMSFDDSKKIQW